MSNQRLATVALLILVIAPMIPASMWAARVVDLWRDGKIGSLEFARRYRIRLGIVVTISAIPLFSLLAFSNENMSTMSAWLWGIGVPIAAGVLAAIFAFWGPGSWSIDPDGKIYRATVRRQSERANERRERKKRERLARLRTGK